MAACADTGYVLNKLTWMREQRIWPNGLRYLWTDAFGVILLASLYRELRESKFLTEAEWVVAEVDRVLGRPRGIRIGEEADRDGQYFHYLAMWIYALAVLAKYDPRYRRKGVELVHQIHDAFLVPGQGVIWKMTEDLSAPYPGFGLGALDAFDGYVAYRLLDDNRGESVIEGLLKADVAVVFNTADTPEERERMVFGDPLETLWKNCVLGPCGVEDVHRETFRVVVKSSDEQRHIWLGVVRGTMREVFETSGG